MEESEQMSSSEILPLHPKVIKELKKRLDTASLDVSESVDEQLPINNSSQG